MREVENFFNLFKENIPQFFVGHVTKKVDDDTYKVLLSKGHSKNDKGFDEYEIEATILFPTIQTGRGLFIDLKPGERVLLMYVNSAYFILGSLKKEEQKDWKRIDEVLLSSGNEEKRSFVLKPNKLTELVITEDDKLVVRTKTQKISIDPTTNTIEIKTKNGINVVIDDVSDKILLKSAAGYGFKVEKDKVEIRGSSVDFYNTPF